MGAVLQATYDSVLPHLTQGRLSQVNPTITITHSHGENELQDAEHTGPLVKSNCKGLKIHLRRIKSDVHSPSIPATSAVNCGGGPNENTIYSTLSLSAPPLNSEARPLSTESPAVSPLSLCMGGKPYILDAKLKKTTATDCPLGAKPRVLGRKSRKTTAPLGRPKSRKLADKNFIPEPLTDADWARISATYWNIRRKEEEMLLATDSNHVAATGLSGMVATVDDPDLPGNIEGNSHAPGAKAVQRSARNRGV
ncbi:hypothetical protein PGTUg99_018898 [Puccinia graminis f. sp. tritici]|uniref:Uncharacterized protein n=1 Tax=Puccinia graminis f. sp. tritici TaxID=56615 RepID=A0A5B0R8R4_PUCGR|nr:hypothetical protein PGTUg99_018898 [Puccinia graminis f. sp. tritici]